MLKSKRLGSGATSDTADSLGTLGSGDAHDGPLSPTIRGSQKAVVLRRQPSLFAGHETYVWIGRSVSKRFHDLVRVTRDGEPRRAAIVSTEDLIPKRQSPTSGTQDIYRPWAKLPRWIYAMKGESVVGRDIDQAVPAPCVSHGPASTGECRRADKATAL